MTRGEMLELLEATVRTFAEAHEIKTWTVESSSYGLTVWLHSDGVADCADVHHLPAETPETFGAYVTHDILEPVHERLRRIAAARSEDDSDAHEDASRMVRRHLLGEAGKRTVSR